MNTNLTKYLSEVLRNEVLDPRVLESKQHEPKISRFTDSKINQFVVDRKYSLRLDEII